MWLRPHNRILGTRSVLRRFPKTSVEKIELHRPDRRFDAYLCLSTDNVNAGEYQINSFLSRAEQEYYAALKFQRRQFSYLIGRYCAKHALCAYLDETDATRFSIHAGVFNQPIVRHPARGNVQISISHSDEWGAALAFPEDHPMGIDIEVVKPEKNNVLQTQLTVDEQILAQVLPHPKATQLTLLWTVKEALSKTIKSGLMTPFELFELRQMQVQEMSVISTFRHFVQYKAVSFMLKNAVCSIICPGSTAAQFNIEKLTHA